MTRGRVRLSAGTPAGCRLVAFAGGILLASITALLVAITIDQTARFLTEGDFRWGAVLTMVALALILGVALYAVGAMTWVYLRMGRTRMWLNGTVLVRRGIALRRRVDLRTAHVELRTSADPREGTLLLLVATAQRSGKTLELPIQRNHATLPASELAALAGAITGAANNAGSTPSDHHLAAGSGRDHVAAMIVVDRLRALAAANI